VYYFCWIYCKRSSYSIYPVFHAMSYIDSIKAETRKWRNVPPPEIWLKGMVVSEWPEYESWLFRNAYFTQSDWLCQRKASRKFHDKPLLSLLTPVYNVSPQFLQECVESVLFQSYPYWELLLFDDGSTRLETLTLLKRFAKIDRRIKVHLNHENLGICRTTNNAISNAKGQFSVFLDHDDKLAPNALFETVKTINRSPDVDIVYSDRDMISERGTRYMHLFKPGWAPETILSSNYLCHLTMYRRSLLVDLGGLDRETEGSQDHDLILRAEETSPRVQHIPKVLYHWRQHQDSVALNPESKEYAYQAASLSVRNALNRRGLTGAVEEIKHLWRGNYRVKLKSPSLAKIYVHSFDSLKQAEWLDIFRKAIESSDGKPYLVFLGPGITTSSEDAIEELTSWFQIPDVVMTTGKIVDKDEKIIHAGLLYDQDGHIQNIYQGMIERSAPGYMAWAASMHNVSLPHPACFALRREVVQMALDTLDASHSLHLVYSLAMKVQSMHKRIVYTPFARFFGEAPEEIMFLQSEKSQDAFYDKWRNEVTKGDPYFSQNLVISNNDIALNFSRPLFQSPD
jgi:glycosyltransferase involved in cell wall biosynthesis